MSVLCQLDGNLAAEDESSQLSINLLGKLHLMLSVFLKYSF